MRRYILTTADGKFIYRGPDGMPMERLTRSALQRLAKKQGLTNYKTTAVSWVELQDLKRRCLHTMQPVTCARVTGT